MFESKPTNPHAESSMNNQTCECIVCGDQRPNGCGICPNCGTYECAGI